MLNTSFWYRVFTFSYMSKRPAGSFLDIESKANKKKYIIPCVLGYRISDIIGDRLMRLNRTISKGIQIFIKLHILNIDARIV